MENYNLGPLDYKSCAISTWPVPLALSECPNHLGSNLSTQPLCLSDGVHSHKNPYQTEWYGTYMAHIWVWFRKICGPYMDFIGFCYGTLPTISNPYVTIYCLSIVSSMGKIHISWKSILFPYMGTRWAMGMVWELKSVPYQTHIYGKDMYFVKIHTIPTYGNDMGYGNGRGWLPCKGIIWEWYGSLNQYHTKPISMGKIHIL